jgi:hypothetical protein
VAHIRLIVIRAQHGPSPCSCSGVDAVRKRQLCRQ